MAGKTVNILLIEDDDVDAEAIMRAFKKFRILNPFFRARDGIEALDILRGTNGKTQIPGPCLLLIDLNMPRMDGIEFLRELRSDENLKKTLAFVLSTSKSDSDKLAAYDMNVAGYLIKSNVGVDFIRMIEMFDHYWRLVEFP